MSLFPSVPRRSTAVVVPEMEPVLGLSPLPRQVSFTDYYPLGARDFPYYGDAVDRQTPRRATGPDLSWSMKTNTPLLTRALPGVH